MESQQLEESQSLLPQVPTEFHNLNMLREPTNSKENNRQNDGWLTKKAENIKARSGNRKIDFRDNVSFVHGTSLRNDISLSQTTVLSSQKDVNSFSQQIDSTSFNEGFTFSQPLVFPSEEDVLTFSQVDSALKKEGEEISSSQRAVTLTEQKDPADRIISRLDRLVSSLDKVSTRQKMVIEATILQCITNLQDSLNNKLKKQQSTTDNTGIFKRLLQTTQTGLLKLTEKQRLEKLQMSQIGSQSMQHLNTQKLNQSALSDFGKRQKRVFSLLKRQKYLVDLFKTRKRSEIATDPYVRFKADQKNVLSRQSETKQVSKSGNIQPNNTNLKRNHISKTCKKLSTEGESETKKIGDSQTEFKNGRAKDNDIVKTSEELSKQISYMRRGSKDSKLTKENMGEGLRNKDFEEEEVFGKELKNLNAGKADKVSCTVRDMTNKGGTGLEDAEDCNLSQDLTTVPDTQDVISQDSVVGNNSDSGDVADITTDISDKEISECSHDRDNELMEAGANFKMNDMSREDQIKVPSIANTEALMSKVSLKRDIGAVAHPVETESIKKSKLIDNEATKVQENIIGKPSELNTSEMLWLNMVRDDINKKADNVQVPKENILDGQGMVTSRRQEEKQTDRNYEKPNFQFIKPKPNVIKYSNLCEAENRSVIDERKEAGNVPESNAAIEKLNKTKEQTDESTRKEVVNSDKNTETVVGLSSPPNLTLPGETWHNISPTATSMSSDVFMVKMKDIQKRMRRRVEMSQNTNIDNIPVVKQVEKIDSEKKEWKVKKVEVFDKQDGSSIQEKDTVSAKIGNDKQDKDTVSAKIGNNIQEKDTVSEAINAVIQQARDLSKENNICRQRFENNLSVMNVNHVASHEPFIPSALGSEVFTTRKMKADTNTKQLQGGLPTLKELVQSGQLTPGKLVLSCFAKGRTHRASLTPVGKIRTQEGFVFVTASQWVSTLTEPVSVKKKKAYDMVLYKGRSLLSICVNYRCNALSNERPTNTATVSTITVDITKSFTEQGTQVKDSDILELFPQKTECEKRLNSLLSNCVVRLLTEQDFVSCDDLPDNFWKEDFSKVRLTKDIWDTVDSW